MVTVVGFFKDNFPCKLEILFHCTDGRIALFQGLPTERYLEGIIMNMLAVFS